MKGLRFRRDIGGPMFSTISATGHYAEEVKVESVIKADLWKMPKPPLRKPDPSY